MEQLVIILLIGVISLINWVIQKSTEMREKRKAEEARNFDGSAELHTPAEAPKPEALRPVFPENDSREKMRRLIEALGLPQEEVFVPPRRSAPPLPEVLRVPPERKQAPMVAQPERVLASSPIRVSSTSVQKVQKKHSLFESLRETNSMRNAIVLSEILGPPRALRPLDLTRGS